MDGNPKDIFFGTRPIEVLSFFFVGFIPSSELSVENNKHTLIMEQSKTNLPAADAMVGRGIILKIGFIILISSYLSDQADFFAWDIMLFESSDCDVATSHM